MVEFLCTLSHPCTLDGVNGIAVDSPLLRGEVGAELLKRYPTAKFAAIRYFDRNCYEIVSLRARTGKNEFDVAALAKKYGGGGHIEAASFRMPNLEYRPGIYTHTNGGTNV
jgi:hypothetical protein